MCVSAIPARHQLPTQLHFVPSYRGARQFGYKNEELWRYLSENGERLEHASELYPLIQSIFERGQGKLG